MSKKQRKQSKGRQNKYLEFDHEDSVDCCSECKSPRVPCNCEIDQAEKPVRPEYQAVKTPTHSYKDGDVVVCPNKAMNGIGDAVGTIFLIYGGEVHVLDANALIHKVMIIEIYKAQNKALP
jgi:hypothetical protein